jgi:hypothetical protein
MSEELDVQTRRPHESIAVAPVEAFEAHPAASGQPVAVGDNSQVPVTDDALAARDAGRS